MMPLHEISNSENKISIGIHKNLEKVVFWVLVDPNLI